MVQCSMARIRELSPDVYRKIAAGEVVERPLSVVKELVENAIDAGADEIVVELGDGGSRLVRVTDNGRGFPPDEIALAFQRHSTSKLIDLEDLDRLTTLGFRGEALASIAEVARVHLATATAEGSGREMALEPGEAPKITAAACARGTRIQVTDLFFNFPVRGKFLKSARTETNRVSSWMEGMALAWEKVAFRLDHNGRTLFDYPRADTLQERAYQVLGRDVAATLQPVVKSGVGLDGCVGLVSRPRTGVTHRRQQFFFVNRRPVREKTLMAALNNAAGPFLEKGKSPVAVLLLQVAPEEVDVNIHPMKLEVRFRDSRAAYSMVFHAVSAAMENRIPGPGIPHPQLKGSGGSGAFLPRENSLSGNVGDPREFQNGTLEFPGGMPEERGFHILGQFHDGYIVVEREGELLVIDQHNAHERVNFERLLRQVKESKVETAAPLFPLIVQLTPSERESLQEREKELEGMGFELEPMSGGSVAIRHYPRLLKESMVPDALRGALHLPEEEAGKDLEVLAGVACKAAVKVNQSLSAREMEQLVTDLFACENPEFCPHRRPVIVHLSLEEIEKRLKRS